jgi:uncharacterized membrane protein
MGFRSWGGYGTMDLGFGILPTIFWLVILADLILLGVWLWKQIQKK